jgi:hypothetical protein
MRGETLANLPAPGNPSTARQAALAQVRVWAPDRATGEMYGSEQRITRKMTGPAARGNSNCPRMTPWAVASLSRSRSIT